MAKLKNKPTDGLGAYEIAKIRSAVRQVWQRSKARKECVKRCTETDGHLRCEICGEIIPQSKFKVDHTNQVGDVNDGFITRMFCTSDGLVGMCKDCHNDKTKEERVKAKEVKLQAS